MTVYVLNLVFLVCMAAENLAFIESLACTFHLTLTFDL